MKLDRSRVFANCCLYLCLAWLAGVCLLCRAASPVAAEGESAAGRKPVERASAVLAGGCFWCVETDFEKCPGVTDVVSGYAGGRSKNPTYENYKAGGHREVVLVAYDPNKVTYAGLVEWLVKHVDATDAGGQFNDRGKAYSPAVYYANAEERQAAEKVFEALNESGAWGGNKRIAIDLEPRAPFWPAEDYHQDYHTKNRLKYNFFRLSSGRDALVAQMWGPRANVLELAGAFPPGAAEGADQQGDSQEDTTSKDEKAKQVEDEEEEKPWEKFRKPSPKELRQKLSSLQYKVTQQDGTEPAFRNTYWDNKREGLYVDVVSGEPLFSSKDKFKSGTGWPSFVKPIEKDAVVTRQERTFFYGTRTEVRSKYADSHLGHVFSDGPPARGGLRYCMNSAALRFIPKEKLEEEGYGEYLELFE